MIACTTIFDPGDIVRVPFPHVERAIMVSRPALVISVRSIGSDGALIWVAMITNAEREVWPGDIIIQDSVNLGLIVRSKVRTAKVSTIEGKSAKRLGLVGYDVLAAVRVQLAANLGFRVER